MINKELAVEREFSEQEKQEMKTQYLADFTKIRFEFSDDLPSTKLTAKDGNYKCRANVVCGVAHRIGNLIGRGIIQNPEIIERGKDYMDYVKNRDFSVFSTQNDIDLVNDILDLMIKELS